MDVNYEKPSIKVVIKIHGIKTKNIQECTDKIMVKGPYWNGIQGQRFLRNLKEQNVLILGRATAAAPGVLAARKLTINKNNIFVLLDKGRGKENVCTEGYIKYGTAVENLSIIDYKSKSLTDEFKYKVTNMLNEMDIPVVIASGDDEFNSLIINYIHRIYPRIYFASANNNIMCCGEGICGSCEINLSGKYIRSCKQQYNPLEYYLVEDGNI